MHILFVIMTRIGDAVLDRFVASDPALSWYADHCSWPGGGAFV